MKASALLIAWHNDNTPIYSVHFDPNGKGRLATAGKYVHIFFQSNGLRTQYADLRFTPFSDNNVRVWFISPPAQFPDH